MPHRVSCAYLDIVLTPSPLMQQGKALHPFNISYVVIDEADTMFDLGFEPQIRLLMGQIRYSPIMKACIPFTTTPSSLHRCDPAFLVL
jgi:superfamily II DNA/RNA helicase